MDQATSDLRGSKVDRESTKDINMKQRRVINAAPAQDQNDYVILAELKEVAETLSKNLTNAFVSLLVSFKTTWIYITKLVVSLIRPATDSATAIQFTKADGTTVVMTVDTLNSHLLVNGAIFSTSAGGNTPPNIPFVRLQYDPAGASNLYGDLASYDPVGLVYRPLGIRASAVTLGSPGGKIAFFTDIQTAPVVQQILTAYSSNAPGAFTGLASGVGGSPYASVADLNNLRTAYNNLRIMCEDLRTKLQGSTLVG